MGVQIRQSSYENRGNEQHFEVSFWRTGSAGYVQEAVFFFFLLTITKQKANRVIRDVNCERHAFIRKQQNLC